MEIELTVYGIETIAFQNKRVPVPWIVATAPTVYGIETQYFRRIRTHLRRLQQHLPFTVLKLYFFE